jgi:hypothetical protein
VEWLDLGPNVKSSGAFDRDLEWVNLDFLHPDEPARAAWARTWPRAGGPPSGRCGRREPGRLILRQRHLHDPIVILRDRSVADRLA